MVGPTLLAWVEQGDFFAAKVVQGGDPIALAKIASATGKTQVRLVVYTAARSWQNVLHLERKIEDGFGRMAVFTAMGGASSRHRIVWVHDGS